LWLVLKILPPGAVSIHKMRKREFMLCVSVVALGNVPAPIGLILCALLQVAFQFVFQVLCASFPDSFASLFIDKAINASERIKIGLLLFVYLVQSTLQIETFASEGDFKRCMAAPPIF
jgi:hypothetical protein